MSAYPDTNFLCRLYIRHVDSHRARQVLEEHGKPLPFTPLHRLEFRNAVRLYAFRRDTAAGKPILDHHGVVLVLRDNEQDLASGQMIYGAAMPWTEAVREADRLSASHTEQDGYRALDLLHVGAALALGAKTFFTYDVRAADLARSAGLKVLN